MRPAHKRDCTRCKLIDCFNLFEKSKDVEDAGKELYVYNLLGNKVDEKEEIGVYICTNGRFLQASCFLTGEIYEHLKEKSYLKDVLLSVTRDFKSSIFLAFSGHYRQAMQVLRCGFENLISGTYFHSDFVDLMRVGGSTQDFDKLERRFNEWKREGGVGIHRTIEVLRRIHFLDRKEERKWHKLYQHLSRFIHTPDEFVSYARYDEEFKPIGKIICPASTYFNEEELSEWSNYFQQVFAILIKIIAKYYAETFETETGKVAISNCILPELKSYGKKIPVTGEILKLLPQTLKEDIS